MGWGWIRRLGVRCSLAAPAVERSVGRRGVGLSGRCARGGPIAEGRGAGEAGSRRGSRHNSVGLGPMGRAPFRRVDGTWVQFEDNACVITNEKGDVQGSDIKGPVSREAAERWPRIAANAKQII